MKEWIMNRKSKTILFIISFSLLCCQGQEGSNEEKIGADQNREVQKEDTLIDGTSPIVDVKVNKKYDAEGNLISYDSTYSYFYSNMETDTSAYDSLRTSFRLFFDKQYPDVFQNYFDQLFFGDSLLKTDFYYDDFFRKRYELNNKYFKQMILKMDSIRNEFFLRHSTEKSLKTNKHETYN